MQLRSTLICRPWTVSQFDRKRNICLLALNESMDDLLYEIEHLFHGGIGK